MFISNEYNVAICCRYANATSWFLFHKISINYWRIIFFYKNGNRSRDASPYLKGKAFKQLHTHVVNAIHVSLSTLLPFAMCNHCITTMANTVTIKCLHCVLSHKMQSFHLYCIWQNVVFSTCYYTNNNHTTLNTRRNLQVVDTPFPYGLYMLLHKL